MTHQEWMAFLARVEKMRAVQKHPAINRTFYAAVIHRDCLASERDVDEAIERLTAPPSEDEFAIQQMVSEGGRDVEPAEDPPARDWAADLALCEAAAKGPWSSSCQRGTPGHCFVAQVWDAEGKALAEVEPTIKEQDASAAGQPSRDAAIMAAVALAEVGRLRALVASLQGRGEKQP